MGFSNSRYLESRHDIQYNDNAMLLFMFGFFAFQLNVTI